MKLKLTISIQDQNLRDLYLVDGYPTLKDLMRGEGFTTELADYWGKDFDDNKSNPHYLFLDK